MADNHETELADHITSYVAAFATGSAERLDAFYADDGVLVPRPGRAVSGPARLAALDRLLALGGAMEIKVRQSYVAGDVALVIVDWSIDRGAESLSGTAADVLRRDSTGTWRYVIDNPFGTAVWPDR